MLGNVLRSSLRGGGRRLSFCNAALEDVPHHSSCIRRIGIPGMHTFLCEDPFVDNGRHMKQGLSPQAAEKDVENTVAKKQEAAGVLVQQLIQLSPDASATPILRKWFDHGNRKHIRAAIVASIKLTRPGTYHLALEVIDFVRSNWPQEMGSRDHMRRLYLTRQVGTIKDVERCFAEVPAEYAMEPVYNQLMAYYIKRGMIAQAESAFQKLLNSGHPVSSVSYGQLLSFYGQHRQLDKGLDLAKDMISAKITPNTNMLNALLSFTAKVESPAKVLSLYKSMRDAGVAPNSSSYVMVIKAYLAAGQQDEAIRATQEMMEHGQKYDFFGFQLMLSFYADTGKEEELKKLWSKVQSFSNVTSRSYGAMIESLGKLGLVKEAEDLATKAERKWGMLEAGIFDALMGVYIRHGRMAAAEELMVRILKERVQTTSLTYKHLIAGHLNAGQPVKALEYLRTSRENNCIHYDTKTWLASLLLVLDYVAVRGEVRLAEEIFEAFTETGSYRSTVVYNVLLKAYVKANKAPEGFVERMAEDGFQPDAETLEMLSQFQACSIQA